MLSGSRWSVGLGAILALAVTGCFVATGEPDGGPKWDTGHFTIDCNPACSGTTPTCTSGYVCRCTASPNSCPTGQHCNSSGVCVANPLCTGVTCPSGEPCDDADGVCRCTQDSCPQGMRCNAATGKCVPVFEACYTKVCADATLPICKVVNAVATCVCDGASCGAGKVCYVDGTCKEVPPCTSTCSGETPRCDLATGTCICTATSCAAGRTCVHGACVGCDHSDACTGKQCGDDGCNPPVSCGSCPDPKLCNGATAICVDPPPCAPACKADEWCDHSRSTDCETDYCCAKICNDPAGCTVSQVCVPDPVDAGIARTGTCQPP